MSQGTPSMVALLGLLAVAGYQNREKIAEALGQRNPMPGGGAGQNDQQAGRGGVLGNLGGLLGGASAGSVLSGGLRDLIERFKQSGHGQAADSWVNTGPNQQLRPEQLSKRSARKCSARFLSTPGSPGMSCCRGSRENCRQRWTNSRRKGVCPPKTRRRG